MFPGLLIAFHEVVRAGSIRKASENLHVAPSSVSRQVAILEQQMGTELIRRSARGIVLTHAGTLVAEFSKSVILDYELLRSDLNDLRGSKRHHIRLAIVESVMSNGPIEAITAFRREFDSVTFEVSLVPAPEVAELILSGTADIGIAFCPEPNSELTVLGRLAEPVVAVFPWDSPYGKSGSVSLADLSKLPLALADPNFGFRRIIERLCRTAGLSPTIIMQSNSFEAIREFVNNHGGAAILPMGAIRREAEMKHLRAVKIAHEELSMTSLDVLISRRRQRSKVLTAFSKTLLECLSNG